MLSQCATAILALMQARQASAHRFIQWYREQLARVEAGELTIPALLEYEGEEMDLPRSPGPDTAGIEDPHWRTNPVRLNVTIWRPYEFGTQRFADGRRAGHLHAGVGTPEAPLARYLANGMLSDRHHGRRTSKVICFEPQAMYRGVLFGTAMVTLMLTADARIHEVPQISADRFVQPARLYAVKNVDGTPKRDPTTGQAVMDLMVEQLLLPKGRTSDDLRLKYDVTSASDHLEEITHLLQAVHGGRVPVVPYDPRHPKAEELGAERYLFQWNRRHLSQATVTGLIALVLDGVVLADRSCHWPVRTDVM